MRLVGKRIERDGSGEVALIADEPEDLWHVYNLVVLGDRVRAGTWRKVQSESSTGSVESSRVHTVLTIAVTAVDFDPQACSLRLNGRNVEENSYVKMGAYHTIDLELNHKFWVIKSEWDSLALDRVAIACDPAKTADVAAVVMQEGLANVCLITAHMTIVRERIHPVIPRKRRGDVAQYEKGMSKFFEQILRAVETHVDFAVVKCLILASPGFVKDQFYTYMMAQAVKREIKVLLENKSKILLAHASSGHKGAVKEILEDPSVLSRLADTKAADEVRVLNQFHHALNVDGGDRTAYGPRHVLIASERGAIDTLLISDGLLRSSDIATRRRYVGMVDSVKSTGGRVVVFSSAHVSGEQLDQLTGIAAILRFPLPDLDDDDDADGALPPQPTDEDDDLPPLEGDGRG